MIVRDEADNLPRCLSSLQGAVDEVVVVDTGSVDDTVRIAREWGAQVSHFDWRDDFAAARNESLRQASGDWIIWLDGDDELAERAPGALKRLCAACPEPAVGYLVGCGDADGRQMVVNQWRVARKLPGLRFQGRIHEQLQPPPGLSAQLMPQDDVMVRHHGYSADGETLRRKSERNRSLLALAIADEPAEPFHYANLGFQHAFEEAFEPALAALRKAHELWDCEGRPALPYVPAMFFVAAAAAFELGRYQEVLDIERQTPPEFASADLLYYAGLACLRLGKRQDAITRLDAARAGALPGIELGDRARATWRPCLALAQAYDEMGQGSPAYAAAKEALTLAPNEPEVLYILASLAHRLPDAGHASAEWLRRLMSGERDGGFKPKARRLLLEIADAADDMNLALEALEGEVDGLAGPEHVLAQAKAYARTGDPERQCQVLQAGCEAVPEDARIRLAFVRLLDERGLSQAALQVAAAGIDQPHPPAELYQQLGLLLAKAGRMQEAAHALSLALEGGLRQCA